MWAYRDRCIPRLEDGTALPIDLAIDFELLKAGDGWISFDWSQLSCCYCGNTLCAIDDRSEHEFDFSDVQLARIDALLACQRCGWWLIVDGEIGGTLDYETWYGVDRKTRWPTAYRHPMGGEVSVSTRDVCGCLASFESGEVAIELPLDELGRHLLARPDDRFRVDPFRFEHLVGSVFRNHGMMVEATARSHDGGVDLFLVDTTEGDRAAVQVKRYRKRIGVSIVREFRGALLECPNVAKGVLVSTSDYTLGATKLAASTTSTPVELIDGNRFLDALRCALPDAYNPIDLTHAPFAKHRMAARESGGRCELNTHSVLESQIAEHATELERWIRSADE